MTVIVSVKINDGIVMAADSVSSFPGLLSYQHANKIANLRKGLPVGAMVTGNGGIGSESIETLFKDIRARFSGDDPAHVDWTLDPTNYSVRDVAARMRSFLFEEKARSGEQPVSMLVRICGYSALRPLAEAWDVRLNGSLCEEPTLVYSEADFGLRWEGEVDALNRLVLGIDHRLPTAMLQHGMTVEDVQALEAHLRQNAGLYELLYLNAMPIQDAIDLAKYLVDTTVGFIRFSAHRPKTVGGPIEIATITKHEGFKWVQRKHFFPRGLNEGY